MARKMDKWINKWMAGSINVQKNGWTDVIYVHMDRWTDVQTERQMVRSMDGQMDKWINCCLDGCTDRRRMDGWRINGWMDVGFDGWMNG